jgi:hypothetical protein
MTKLLNLESYTDFCRYTQIFKAKFPVNNSGIPIHYKNFLMEYRDHPFLQSPILLNDFPDSLTSRSEALIPHTLGIELDDKKTDDLVIVRDIDVLSLRSLGGRYLYASAYRYWNFVSQLKDIAQTNKPIVIYDLDSLPCPYYLPISFENHPNCSYPIPILDTRTVENHDKLKPSFHNSNIYDSICKNIAQIIILSNSNFTEIQIFAIAEYLKRIDIFKILQTNLSDGSNTQNLSILIEISQPDSSLTYLPAILNVQDIERILVDTIPIEELRQITQQHPQYNSILISQYNCFPSFRSSLENDFFLPDIARPEFTHIWQLSQNFPLYGQYLDLITFELANNIEVEVPDQNEIQAICYEGEAKSRTFIGKYCTKNGEIKSLFPMETYQAILPIKINHKPIIENEKEQVYTITNIYFKEDPKLYIEIHFSLAIGRALILEVIDSKGRKLQAELGDRPEPALLGFIPIQNILEDRKTKEKNALLNLSLKSEFLRKFQQGVTEIINIFHKPVLTNKLTSLHNIIKNVYIELLKDDTLRYISPDQNLEILKEITEIIELNQLASSLQKFLPILSSKYQQTETGIIKKQTTDIYNHCILLIGKTYQFSGTQEFIFLFDYLNTSLKKKDEHIKVLARISSQENFQKKYFQLFDYSEASSSKKYYQSDPYMWGYARILLWYLEFRLNDKFIPYKNHFQSIIQYALSNESNRSYYQDSLISLIYLLTFRELDKEFCLAGSDEYIEAKKLCEKLSKNPVFAYQISRDKSLNEIFEEFLDGVADNKQILDLLNVE